MESQNIEFRAVIKFLTKEGAKAKEIHRRMADVYGDSSPKYSTVAKWSAEFKRGRDSLEDDPSSGRPADVISQEMYLESNKHTQTYTHVHTRDRN